MGMRAQLQKACAALAGFAGAGMTSETIADLILTPGRQ
jgi:hypothetical protein